MKPKLIHPVWIEIQFVDKSKLYRNTKLRETIGEAIYHKPIRILGQYKAIIKPNQVYVNMTKGGADTEGEGYYLVYKEDIPKEFNQSSADLKKIRGAKIIKIIDQEVDYKIIDACDITHYDLKSYFIKLTYVSIQSG